MRHIRARAGLGSGFRGFVARCTRATDTKSPLPRTRVNILTCQLQDTLTKKHFCFLKKINISRRLHRSKGGRKWGHQHLR